MRKTLTAAMAAITLGGAIGAAAGPAEARDWGHHGYYGGHYYHQGNGGAAVAAGVLGLALGAAIANTGPHYYRSGYYAPPPPYYDYDSGYGYGYRTCESTRWTWDPYWRREVPVTTRYAC